MRPLLLIAALAALGCETRHAPSFEPSPADRAPSPQATSCPVGVCDDGNRCTVDTCDHGLCAHTALRCAPPDDPCLVAVCDLEIGCALTAAEDGIACAPQSCVDETISTCFAGACVRRQAFAGELACNDTWARGYLDEQLDAAWAFDEQRGRLVLFSPGDGAYQNETWEFDGTEWAKRTTPVAPGQAFGVSLAFDRARGRTVLFAGWDVIQTWEWDGVQWQQLSPSSQPAKREGQTMFFDPARNRVVLYGGVECRFNGCGTYGDFWEWDGSAWTELPVTAGPPPLWNTALAFDEARGRLVQFGGQEVNGVDVFGDTWEWDGTGWEQRTPVHSPPPRFSASLAYDRKRQRTVLFGGFDTQFSRLSDVWEWDGDDWVEVPFTSGPGRESGDDNTLVFLYDPTAQQVVLLSAESRDRSLSASWRWDGANWTAVGPLLPVGRSYGSLGYDPAHEQVLMFGGRNGAACCDVSVVLGDSWTWNGARWSKVPGPGPAAREHASMVFDGTREQVLLFGGTTDGRFAFADTWGFDGTQWRQLFPRTSPPARFGAAIAYDNRRQRVVLFGGVGQLGAALADTWEWDGTGWIEVVHGAFGPPPRSNAKMAYDELNQQLVLFGGSQDFFGFGSSPLGDTWNFDGKKWVQRTQFTNFVQARQDFGLAYDSKRQRVTMFGGNGQSFGSALADTEVWDGSLWQSRWPKTAPQGLGGIEMAYDAKRDQFVVFGGAVTTDARGTTNTWVYLPPP